MPLLAARRFTIGTTCWVCGGSAEVPEGDLRAPGTGPHAWPSGARLRALMSSTKENVGLTSRAARVRRALRRVARARRRRGGRGRRTRRLERSAASADAARLVVTRSINDDGDVLIVDDAQNLDAGWRR